MKWDGFEAPPVGDAVYDTEGPEMILLGRGCRLILTACRDADKRDEDLKNKVRAAAERLLRAEVEGVSAKEQPDMHPLSSYHGTLAPIYIRGTDAASVTTSLAKALLKAPPPVAAELKALGVRALMEWSE